MSGMREPQKWLFQNAHLQLLLLMTAIRFIIHSNWACVKHLSLATCTPWQGPSIARVPSLLPMWTKKAQTVQPALRQTRCCP
jgi:hypothetical protein